MKLLEFPEEVKSLYLEHCHIINNYIEEWINASLVLKTNNRKVLRLSSNVLKSLSLSLDISVNRYRSGNLKLDFDDQLGITKIQNIPELLISRLILGVNLELNFAFGWFPFSDRSMIPDKVFDKIKSINLSESDQTYHNIEIESKDLDLSNLIEWDNDTSNISSDILVSRISSKWNQMKSFEEISSAIDMIKIIHDSLRELKDDKTALIYVLSHLIPVYPVLNLSWRLMIIPDTLILSFSKNLLSFSSNLTTKDLFRNLNIYIPEFSLTLNISKD